MEPHSRGFKKKTIEQVIRQKIHQWIRSINDDSLQQIVRDNYIVTGGAIASMLQGQLPNDYDVYFATPDAALAVANYYIKDLKTTDKVSTVTAEVVGNENGEHHVKIMLKSAGVAFDENADFSEYQYFEGSPVQDLEQYMAKEVPEKKMYKPACITSNAITLYGGVQIIIRFVGAPEQIHKNYDFVHCTNWYTAKSGLVLNQPALESIISKELRYVGSRYPLCSMFRIKKFIQRGWTVTAGEMLKIAWDISKLDLNSTSVLQDQLVGVDAAYFHQLIDLLIKEGKPLDRTYLFEIVNRVFDELDPIAEVMKSNPPEPDYSNEPEYQRNMDEGV